MLMVLRPPFNNVADEHHNDGSRLNSPNSARDLWLVFSVRIILVTRSIHKSLISGVSRDPPSSLPKMFSGVYRWKNIFHPWKVLLLMAEIRLTSL